MYSNNLASIYYPTLIWQSLIAKQTLCLGNECTYSICSNKVSPWYKDNWPEQPLLPPTPPKLHSGHGRGLKEMHFTVTLPLLLLVQVCPLRRGRFCLPPDWLKKVFMLQKFFLSMHQVHMFKIFISPYFWSNMMYHRDSDLPCQFSIHYHHNY